MRYINGTKFPTYVSETGSMLPPGRSSQRLDSIEKFLGGLSRSAGKARIELDEGDRRAILRFVQSASGAVSESLRRELAESFRKSSSDVYNQSESTYIEQQRMLAERIRDREESEARINSESNYILPDGRPVGKDESSPASAMSVPPGTVVEPRIVERPSSPLDILAHNAKVSTERAQTEPLSGKAAVAARKGPPGMPNLPGIEKQVENLKAEEAMAAAMKSGVRPVMTSDMLASGERRNYGRK